MDSYKDSVAFWATVLGTLLAFFGVIQSRAWLAGLGAVVVAGSIAAVAYANRQRALVKSAGVKIEGRSIDSLNLANLRRRLNRSLVIQRVENMATIDGEDLTICWKCSGYGLAPRESAIEFSIDAETNIPIAELECVAFDLRRDPRRRHPIRPILIGPDGISKKIAVPLLAPISQREPFSVFLKCRLPGCMRNATDYYAATLSFDQETVPRYSATLRFAHGRPEFVRAYECLAEGSVRLLRNLRSQSDGSHWEYLDTAENVPAQSARVYLFSRTTAIPVSKRDQRAA